MNLSTEIEKKDNAIVSINVTVPKEEISTQFDLTIKEYIGKVKLGGFRKGKAPKNLVYQKYKDNIHYDAIDKVLNKVIKKIVDEQEIKIYSSPKVIKMDKLNKENDFNFVFEVETLPTVEIENYKNIEYKKIKFICKDEDIDKRLKQLQQDESMVIDKEKEAAEKNDRVTFDYNFFLIGKTKEEPENNLQVTLGEKTNMDWLDNITDDFHGKSIGHEATYDNIIIPKEHPNESLAGKNGKIYIKITKVEKIEIPELDDEFAKDLEFDNLDDLKNDIKNELQTECNKITKDTNITSIIQKIIEKSIFQIPESLIEEETENQKNFVFKLFGQNQKIIDEFYNKNNESKVNFDDNMRKAALDIIKKELTMNEIITKEDHLKATKEEIENKIKEYAEKYNITIDKMKDEFNKNNSMFSIARNIEIEKLYNFLDEESIVKEEEEKHFEDRKKTSL